jgi:hypothetical protein
MFCCKKLKKQNVAEKITFRVILTLCLTVLCVFAVGMKSARAGSYVANYTITNTGPIIDASCSASGCDIDYKNQSPADETDINPTM